MITLSFPNVLGRHTAPVLRFPSISALTTCSRLRVLTSGAAPKPARTMGEETFFSFSASALGSVRRKGGVVAQTAKGLNNGEGGVQGAEAARYSHLQRIAVPI